MRELSDKGRAGVERVAAFLKRGETRVPRIVHSGLVRAEQTAAILHRAIGEDEPLEVMEGLGPFDRPAPIAAALERAAADVMLVGHQPFMGRLLAYLLGDADDESIRFRTGGLVCLERARDRWQLAWMITPNLLSGAGS